MTQPQAELFDLYRAGLRSAADLMKTSLESAERLQTLQSRLAGLQFERAMSLWSDLCQVAGEAQRDAIVRLQQQITQALGSTAAPSAPARQGTRAKQPTA